MGTSILLCSGIIFCLGMLTGGQGTTSVESSEEEQLFSGGYILPKQIFNEGKPFYVDKDPVSGQLDFSSKKPAGIEPEANEVVDPKEKIVLNNSSPNIHDFLNLPVKYSSSKFVYPLVSSSYANLKYQGNNKNFISNHKNHTDIVVPPPKYFNTHRANVTRLQPATFPYSTTDRPLSFGSLSTEKAATKNKFAPTKKYVSSTTVRTTFKPTTKPSTVTRPTTTSTTMKPSTTATVFTSPSTATFSPPSITTTIATTTTILPSTEPPSTTTTRLPSTTPILLAIATTELPTYKPFPPLTTLPNLDAAEVYNSVGQKKDPSTMSLEDIFNAFSEDSFPNRTYSQDDSTYPIEDLPASQPAPFAVPTTLGQPVETPSETELTPQTNPIKDSNNYVHYKVQQPVTNVVQYHVPSMNNIVISPDQNSTSFVIGSQQSVGSSIFVGNTDKEPMFGNEQQIHYGTVINEQLTPTHGHTNAQQGPPLIHQVQATIGHNSLIPHQGSLPPQMTHQPNDRPYQALPLSKPSSEKPDTQELYVQSNIKFPSEENINGHGNPVGLGNSVANTPQNFGTPSNPVVFPKTEYPEKGAFNNFQQAGNPIIFQQDDRATEKMEILTLNQQKLLDKKFPRLPENLTPPNPSDPHMWPVPRPQQVPSTTNTYNDFTRKPLSGLRRPNPDRPLPNILPQFRPNAKISHGHSNYNREPGNIRVPYSGPHLNRPKMPVPPFAHRRTPVINRPNYKGGPESMDNRRVYQVPPARLPPGSRIYLQRQHRPPPLLHSPQRVVDGFGAQRHSAAPEQFFLPSQEQPERLPVFEEEDFITNDPPKPIVKKDADSPSLEPVVTLQMLKSQKRTQSPVFQKLYPEEPVAQPVAQPIVSSNPQTLQTAASGQSPVYVVYPMKAEAEQLAASFGPETPANEHVVVGHRGDQSPVPPAEVNKAPQAFDYENTPFSVVREQAQEPILMVKNKSQPYDNGNFPYPLEKPDPAFAEFSKQQNVQIYDQNNSPIEISPRVVNRGQGSDKNSPIAVAYTPTEATHLYPNHQPANKFSRPNSASQVIPEIQGDPSLSEDLDTRGQHYEKDFMAPFYPSVSLSEASNPQKGWSVFTAPSTDGSIIDKANINRADVVSDGLSATTEKFDPNRFQPELQGGFKPIYPPEYKQRNDDYDSEEAITEKLIATSTTNVTPTVGSTESITSTQSPVTTTSTDMPKKERVKSSFEASLESLLFGDDELYDDDMEKDNTSS